MKLPPPYPLPPGFPPHAPLPPGGPWIRPPLSAARAQKPCVFPPPAGEPRPRAPLIGGYPLGVGLPPALTPLAMVEEERQSLIPQKRSA